MNLHTTRTAKAGLLAFFAVTIALGLVLSARFGGPSLHTRAPLRASVLVADAGGTPKHADVLIHGVKVGVVAGFQPAGAATRLELELDPGATPALRRDASVRIAAKTPLGESFVDLDPGKAPGAPLPSGSRLRAKPAVEIDEALRALDPGARSDLKAIVRTTGRTLASPAAATRVSGTLDGIDATVTAIDRAGDALAGQAGDIAATTADARTILGALAERDADVRGTIHAARTTLAATAAQRRALSGAVDELPGFAREATATLRAADPLLRDADPVVAQVRDAAPRLTGALRALPATLRDADAVLRRAPALRAAATPALRAVHALAPVAQPAIERLGPTLADAVPMLRYLDGRTDTIAAWFSNTADLGSNGDAKGKWARFFVGFDPASLTGAPVNAPPGNAYTPPHDALHNQPYKAGDFPRLMPYPQALGR